MEKYTVFVASPADVKKERDLLQEVIAEVNLTHGAPMGYELDLWRYEENAFPSAQKPQDLINGIITPYQIFIGIMWKRLGTPTQVAASGTVEEYQKAYAAWQKKQVLDIMFFFCKKPFLPETTADAEQIGNVLKFKEELSGKSFIWDYKNPNDFEEIIRKKLCLMMSNIIQQKKNPGHPKTKPDAGTIALFNEMWNRMTPELQHFLSIPYNENRMKGDAGIQTKDLFAAMVTNPTPELDAVIKHIPKKALPGPIEGKLVTDVYITVEQPWLSHCIASSIKRLSKTLPVDQQLSALDVFIDIARNGTGDSVQLLRDNNITPEVIEQILQQENLEVLHG